MHRYALLYTGSALVLAVDALPFLWEEHPGLQAAWVHWAFAYSALALLVGFCVLVLLLAKSVDLPRCVQAPTHPPHHPRRAPRAERAPPSGRPSTDRLRPPAPRAPAGPCRLRRRSRASAAAWAASVGCSSSTSPACGWSASSSCSSRSRAPSRSPSTSLRGPSSTTASVRAGSAASPPRGCYPTSPSPTRRRPPR